MARVILGSVGTRQDVASQTCVKTGLATNERLTIRGSTTPGWIHVLLIFTLIGWLFAIGNTQRRFVVTVPFTHAIHDRWRRLNRLAWLLGIGGIAATLWAVSTNFEHTVLLLGVPLGSLILGLVNSWTNNVGVRQNQDAELLLVRVHPAAASAMARSRAIHR